MPINARFIPVLLLRGSGAVKTVGFEGGTYLGDILNTVAIFNEKMVDEIVVLDIDAPRTQRRPQFGLLRELASECFMPLAFGGGISSLEDFDAAIAAGAEKVIITTAFADNPGLVSAAAARFGSQSVVVGLDVRPSGVGTNEVFVSAGRRPTGLNPVAAAKIARDAGAGEIVVQSIERDGSLKGYDLDLVRGVTSAVDLSVVALGGAQDLQSMANVIVQAGASAAAAGSVFVFFGRLRAVLVNVPNIGDRTAALERAQLNLRRVQ
jgi:cyclase